MHASSIRYLKSIIKEDKVQQIAVYNYTNKNKVHESCSVAAVSVEDTHVFKFDVIVNCI